MRADLPEERAGLLTRPDLTGLLVVIDLAWEAGLDDPDMVAAAVLAVFERVEGRRSGFAIVYGRRGGGATME